MPGLDVPGLDVPGLLLKRSPHIFVSTDSAVKYHGYDRAEPGDVLLCFRIFDSGGIRGHFLPPPAETSRVGRFHVILHCSSATLPEETSEFDGEWDETEQTQRIWLLGDLAQLHWRCGWAVILRFGASRSEISRVLESECVWSGSAWFDPSQGTHRSSAAKL